MVFSCPVSLGFSLAVTIPQTCLVFDDFDRLEAWLGTSWEVALLDLSDAFLLIRQRLWFIGRKTQRKKTYCHHIKLPYHPHDIRLDAGLGHPAEVCPPSPP